MGAWIAAAAVVSAYLGYQSSKEAGKAKAEPMYTARNMPADLLDRYEAAQAAMPVSANIGFGDQTYPTFYGPNARMTQMLYAPAGATPANPAANPYAYYGAAMQAAMPYVQAWAQNRDTTTTQHPNQQQQAPQNNRWA
jgi:hypothetical protein